MVSSDPSTNALLPKRRAYKGDRKGVLERSRKTRRVGSIVRDERILRREKATLSNDAKKSHKTVLITVIENTYIGFTMGRALFQAPDTQEFI